MKRDLVSIEDLSNPALVHLMDLADRIRKDLRGHAERLPGFLMGSLFLEPSTRTRLSFEAAMARLGGKVITSADPDTSSAVKGETLSDTVRIVDSYVDMTVLRHPLAGAARWAARHARGAIVNAGDGAREHPTQTLCDLYSLRCERGRLDGLTVMLYGDLRYGRTTHSLARALARFGATIIAVAEKGLELPDAVLEELREVPGTALWPAVVDDLADVFRRDDVPALVIGPERDLPAVDGPVPLGLRDREVDAIYVTRLQTERLEGESDTYGLPILDHRFLESPPFRRTVVLHPLPRVGEIAREVDEDPRAAYFRQAALGVPIRMALLLWMGGRVDLPTTIEPGAVMEQVTNARCTNARCITQAPLEGVAPEFGRRPGGAVRCMYCEAVAETPAP